jgi:hypothetical protein
LYFNVESSSLFRGGPVISELKLVGPALRVVRLPDGRFNFSDLIDEFMARPPSDDPTPAFSLNNIQISGGKIDFDDQLLGEKHVISDVTIALPFVSSLPAAVEIFVEPAFSASINGSPLIVQGRSKPFAEAMESELALDLRHLQLGKYLDYLPIRLPIQSFRVLDSDLKLSFPPRQAGHSVGARLSGSVVINDVEVKDPSGAPLVSLKRLELLVWYA